MARARVSKGLVAVHVLQARRDVEPLLAAGRPGEFVVGHRHLDVDRHAPDGVHDLLEPLEVDLDEVADLEVVQLAEDRLERVVPARPIVPRPQVGTAPVLRPERVDLLAVVAAPHPLRRPGWNGHIDGVARQAEHRHLLGDRIDRDRDERVGVVAALLLVRADQQDVQPLPAIPFGHLDRRHGRPDDRRVGRRRLGRLDGLIDRPRVGRGGRGGRIGTVGFGALVDEDAVREVPRQEVDPRDDDVGTGHDQEHRGETGDRQRVARQPGAPETAVAGRRVRIEVLGDPVGVDDRDDPVDERDQVEDEDRADELDEGAQQLEAIHPDHEAGDEREHEERGRREQQRARRDACIQVPESREEEGQERRCEGRPGARSRLLRALHRA